MDDNRNKRTDYEPNFILKESPAEDNPAGDDSSEEFSQTGFLQASENQQNECSNEDKQNEHSSDSSSIGTYHDPRSNFKKHKPHINYNSDNDPGTRCRRKRSPSGSDGSRTITFTRKTLVLLLILVMVISVVFGGTAAVIANSLMGNDTSSSSRSSSGSKNYTLEDSTGSSMSIADITEKTQDSVVEIQTESISSDSWIQEYVTEGAGSGVIISSDGYIITNNHVIEGASKITVTTTSEKSYSAKVVGTDTINDIAVLKINAKNLNAVTYGNSDKLEVGELAVAIGNPLGELGGSVTSGIISALDREVNIDGKAMHLLQTDASINPGNSGGGLFNDNGQLIGLVVAKSSGSDIDNIGFAIPVNTVADVADQLMSKGYVSNQPTTGMSYTEQSSGSGQLFGDMGLTDSSAYVFITKVSGKNAKSAGFKAGDMVYAVDGKVISSFDDLSTIITSKKAGDKIKYTIVRDSQTKDITFTLEEKKS